jgi:hypothetical protein
MVLQLISCSPRGPGSFAPVIPEKLASQELDTSVGVSGPHDFAVRFKRRSSCVAKASTASHPASVTFSSRPSEGWDDSIYSCFYLLVKQISEIRKLMKISIWGAAKPNTLESELNDPNHVESAQEIRFLAHAMCRGPSGQANEAAPAAISTDLPSGKLSAPTDGD